MNIVLLLLLCTQGGVSVNVRIILRSIPEMRRIYNYGVAIGEIHCYTGSEYSLVQDTHTEEFIHDRGALGQLQVLRIRLKCPFPFLPGFKPPVS